MSTSYILHMPLKRDPKQKLQKESFNEVGRILNDMNYEMREMTPDNSGIDIEIELVKNGNFSAKIIKAQIKAGLSYISSENDDYLRIKIEKKYVEHWRNSNVPVILFYYHPDTHRIYWKSILDYIKVDPKILAKESNNVIIPMDKSRDIFEDNVQSKFEAIVNGTFEYEKYIFTKDNKEKIESNWFPVESLPSRVYVASTKYRYHYDITSSLKGYYPFILKDEKIYSFSDLNNTNNELRNFCDVMSMQVEQCSELPERYFVELLNRVIAINAIQRDLVSDKRGKFYFHHRVLRSDETNVFTYKPLKSENESTRTKIYIRKGGKFEHHAIKLNFHKINDQWYLEIEPDYHVTYKPGIEISTKRIGAEITKLKHKMFNQSYLYLLHAMKMYLAGTNKKIIFTCDSLLNSQVVEISLGSVAFTSDFLLFNDYKGPKI